MRPTNGVHELTGLGLPNQYQRLGNSALSACSNCYTPPDEAPQLTGHGAFRSIHGRVGIELHGPQVIGG